MICYYGSIGQIYDFGMHDTRDEDSYEMCMNNDYMKACKPDNPSFLNMLNNAVGKNKFSFAFTERALYSNPAAKPEKCFNINQNSMFIQYSCV